MARVVITIDGNSIELPIPVARLFLDGITEYMSGGVDCGLVSVETLKEAMQLHADLWAIAHPVLRRQQARQE
jgi:hypothetical protein